MPSKKKRVSPNEDYYDKFFCFKRMGFEELLNFVFPDNDHSEDGRFEDLVGPQEKIVIDIANHEHINSNVASVRHLCETKSGISGLSYWQKAVRRRLYESLDKDLGTAWLFDKEAKMGSAIDESSFTELMLDFCEDSKSVLFHGQESLSYSIGPSIFNKQRSLGDEAKCESIDPASGHSAEEEGDGDGACSSSAKRDIKGILYTPESIFSLYEEGGYKHSLANRYNRAFHERVCGFKDMDYKFYSWMQNPVSFSPFIDFTDDYGIALMRIVKANNPSSFMYKDSAIYFLSVPNKYVTRDEEKADDAIKGMKHVVYLRDKIVPGTKVEVEDRLGTKKDLDFSSYRKILGLLVPKLLVIDIPYSDRMRRKRGKYVFFYDYVAVKGMIFAGLGNDITLSRHVICYKNKRILRKQLKEKRPNLRNSSLDDPGLEFKL